MWENLYEHLRSDSEIRELIRRGDANLGVRFKLMANGSKVL